MTRTSPGHSMLERFAGRLADDARVLELGCGPGVPATRQLARRFQVTGIDISSGQLELARRNVPEAAFVEADMAEVRFPPGSFEGVVALYSVVHLPREEHSSLFARIAGWLVPGGSMLVTLGAADDPGSIEQWLGVPMFFSSHDPDANRSLIDDAGFERVVDEIVETMEPGGPVAFHWLLARKSNRPPVRRRAGRGSCGR
jgi:cyclopropane fatty-acyl-phospholipid synthase-like methyltransferase